MLVRLTIMEGNELVALLDEAILRPHSQLARTYGVPATKLEISITGIDANNTKATADVLIYGQYCFLASRSPGAP